MNPPQLLRSRLFWLGLPGFAFLLWVWLLLPNTFQCLSLEMAETQLIAGMTNRQISLHKRSFRGHVLAPQMRGLKIRNGLLSSWSRKENPFFPKACSWKRGEHGDFRFFLASWLIVSIYLILWVALSGCWQLRKSRLLKRHTYL